MNRMIRVAALLTAVLLISCTSSAFGEGMLGITVRYTPAPSKEPSAAPTAIASETTPAAQTPVTLAEADAAHLGERILMRGMEGEDVKIVQRRLYELGYYLGEVDGVFGLRTRSAVFAFQRAHKLEKIDGKVGSQTIGALFSENAIIKPTPTPTPTPSPEPTPVPTATPNAGGAPFALEAAEVYVDDLQILLALGTDDRGEKLYPMCGVLSHMGYEYAYAAGSWQFIREKDGSQIALMTAGMDGLNLGAMGSYNGVVFLADDDARVYVYEQEAYVTETLLERMGVSIIVVGNTPVIH